MTVDVPAKDILLAAANGIAATLCESAIWDSSQHSCHWLDENLAAGQSGRSYTKLSEIGGSLYGGTAGIALFLSETAALNGNGRFAEVAAGAARHAFRHAPANMGLYSGRLGIAFALLRISQCLADSNIYQDCQDLLARSLQAEPESPDKLDVMAGLAGTILGLLNINRRTPNRLLVLRAKHVGRILCKEADWTDTHCSWLPDMAGEYADRPLTGFSHGSSGIGAALLALFAETHEKEFLTTGRAAFAYDDMVFDRQRLAWPDMRLNPMNIALETWCYGAPGILIARVIAAAADPEYGSHHRYYTQVAANTTLRSLHEYWMRPGRESCICHGSLGACEALMIASEHGLEDNLRREAVRAIQDLVERHPAPDDWPLRLQSPTLLTGLAGVGHALLRAARPDLIAPVLMIH